MPRELARQSARQEAAGSHRDTLEVEVRQTDQAVRVTLSGILDRPGVEKLMGQVTRRLPARGCRIIMDGSRLTHLDYRATDRLVEWNRRLGQFGHQLLLHRWSPYLKAILLMEDWDSELSGRSVTSSTLRLLGGSRHETMP